MTISEEGVGRLHTVERQPDIAGFPSFLSAVDGCWCNGCYCNRCCITAREICRIPNIHKNTMCQAASCGQHMGCRLAHFYERGCLFRFDGTAGVDVDALDVGDCESFEVDAAAGVGFRFHFVDAAFSDFDAGAGVG